MSATSDNSRFYRTGRNFPRWLLRLLELVTPATYTNALRCKDCGQTFPYGGTVTEDSAMLHACTHVALLHPEDPDAIAGGAE